MGDPIPDNVYENTSDTAIPPDPSDIIISFETGVYTDGFTIGFDWYNVAFKVPVGIVIGLPKESVIDVTNT